MGQVEYQLRALADEQLLAGLASVVKRRNQVTAEFLAYLAEFDERRLYLDLGFASLFEYCVQALRLCESTAGRHIAAARVCRAHPQVFAWVASGELHASALSLLRKHLTTENAAELFERCRRQSARQVEELLAARFPRPDVRDLVRRLPARAGIALDVERAPEHNGACLREKVGTPNIGSSSTHQGERLPGNAEDVQAAKESSETVRAARMNPTGSSEVPLVAVGIAEPAKPRRIEPLAADRYGVHFTADREFCELLERVRGLAMHRLPSGDLMTLLKRGLEAYERELKKERFAVGRKPRRSSAAKVATGARSNPEVSLKEPSTATPTAVGATLAEPLAAAPPSPELPSPELAQAGRSAPELARAERNAPELARVGRSAPELARVGRSAAELHRGDSKADSLAGAGGKRTWHCPAVVAREVFERDGGRCTFVAPDGRRCCARRWLEFDHVVPRARGGEDSVSNLRLRCRAHNQLYARQCFGVTHVQAAVQDSRGRRSVEAATRE